MPTKTTSAGDEDPQDGKQPPGDGQQGAIERQPGTKRIPVRMAAEIGSTGLKRYADDYATIEEEWLPQLQGDFARRVYLEMSQNDPIVGAFLFVIDMLMRKIEWHVEPFSDDEELMTDEDEDNALFVEECMQDMDMAWSDVISEAMSFLPFGWSLLEIVYKRRDGLKDDDIKSSRFDDGRVGWARLPIRAQDTLNGWQFDPKTRALAGMRQLAPPDWEDALIPAHKFLLFRTTSRRNSPEGVSILRTAYRAWWFKKRLEEIEGIGIDRDLAGLPVAYVPPELLGDPANLSDGQKALRAALQALVTRVRRDRQEGVLFPLSYSPDGKEEYRFELLSTGGARQFNTNEVIGRYEARIAMTVLADFLLLGTQNVGSWALSTDKVNLFNEALKTWAKMIADVFNRQAIPRLFKLNGLDQTRLPTLKAGEIVTPNLTEIGDFITKLSGAGMPMFPNEEFEDYLFSLANFPEISEAVRAEWEAQKELEMQQAQMGLAAMGQDVELKGAQTENTKVGSEATKMGMEHTKAQIAATHAGIEQTKAGVEATKRSTQLMGKEDDPKKPGGAKARTRSSRSTRKPAK